MAFANLACQPLAGGILKIHPVFLEFIEKKWKIGLKIAFGTLGSIPLVGRILRIYPAFLEFTKTLFLKFVIFPIFYFLTKTGQPHKETPLVVVSFSFISDAFRL